MPALTLQVRHSTKSYQDRRAVSDLSFTAHRGEIVGFVGPNGAGKTSTIRMLATVLQPTSGEFEVAGIPGHRPTEIRRRIGVLPESAGYPGRSTGQEFLRYFGRLHGLGREAADRRARRLLSEFGLLDRGDWPISTYSRGMRQRLGIARAVVNDPVVVFLDEPTVGLDPAGQQQALDIIRDLAQRRRATVLLSTHALAVVEQICSSVLVLDRGTTVSIGTVDEVSQRVADRQVLRLRVPADQVERARAAIAALARLGRPDPEIVAEPSGLLTLRLPHPAQGQQAGRFGDLGGSVLRAVLDAGVPVLSFDIDGSRFSDAFFSVTTGSRR
jgi:ABC-2 type transport system ATP-binding protein